MNIIVKIFLVFCILALLFSFPVFANYYTNKEGGLITMKSAGAKHSQKFIAVTLFYDYIWKDMCPRE